jgi:O-6-methylguanine DNA methyltransferase
MRLVRRIFDTPVGPMMALATDTALCALEFGKAGRLTRLDARLRRWFTPFEVADGDNHVTALTGDWLEGYFAPSTGSGQAGSPPADPPLDMRGAAFELRVWAALRRIPPGETVSYGEIARRIGAPAASRAVGLANGANPIAIIVPCHRVIGSNGTLIGYGGGLDRKAWLLNHEHRAMFPETLAASGRLPLGD